MTTAAHTYDVDTPCPSPRCQEAEGFQCADCGHYHPRNQIVDIGGEYYCRDRMGHNR